jgi:hypothetical protein
MGNGEMIGPSSHRVNSRWVIGDLRSAVFAIGEYIHLLT